jgi:O-antigen/teichoic acid export membrane protein
MSALPVVSREPAPSVLIAAPALSLRRNFSWTLLGNIIYAGCQWAMLVVLAKLGTAEMVGQFALALALTAPVTLFASLKLRTIQATDARGEYRFADYFGLRLITTALALLVTVGIVLAGRYRPDTAWVILVMGLAKAVESFSDLFYGLLQQHERMDRIAQSMAIKGILSLAALGLGVYLTHTVLWGVVGLTAAWTVVLVSYDLPNGAAIIRPPHDACAPGYSRVGFGPALQPRWDAAILVRLATSALPLGLVVMLDSLYTNVPRYFIEHRLGESELGIFAAIGYLMFVGSTIINALGQSASPRLAKYYAAGDQTAFDALLLRIIGLGGALGATGVLLAMAAGHQVLTFLYRPEYARHADVFVWLMAAAGLQYAYVFLGTAVNAMRRFTIQLPIQALSLLVTLFLCLCLVSGHGLKGAAWAMLGTAAFEAAAYALLTAQTRQIRQKLTSEAGAFL